MTVKCLQCGLNHDTASRNLSLRSWDKGGGTVQLSRCPNEYCRSLWTVDEAKVNEFMEKIGK
jgi:hypothetical protein